MKIGIFTNLFQDKSLEEVALYVSSLGYQMVELPAWEGNPHLDIEKVLKGDRSVKKILKKYNLDISALNCGMPGQLVLGPHDESTDEFAPLSDPKEKIKYAIAMMKKAEDNFAYDVTAYTDGAARGNPGPSAAAAVLMRDGKVVAERSIYLGHSTNNRAEYEGTLLALEAAAELGATSLVIYTDSELIARQVRGQYKVKNADLMPLREKVVRLAAQFEKFAIIEIPRGKNSAADGLANVALDLGLGVRARRD